MDLRQSSLMEAAGRGRFPGEPLRAQRRAAIHTRSSSDGRAWPSPSLGRRDATPSRGIPRRCPTRRARVGRRSDVTSLRGKAASQTPSSQVPLPNILATPLLEDPSGTGARRRPDLSQPPRTSVASRCPGRPAQGSRWLLLCVTRHGTLLHQGYREPHGKGACLAKLLRGCSSTALAPTCGCSKGRGSPGLRMGGDPPCKLPPLPGLGKPRCSRPCGWRVPPSFLLHPPPPSPGRSPALPRGDAAGRAPSLLAARGPPHPRGSPRSIPLPSTPPPPPTPSPRTWGR